jgi:hypothetical protein
MNALRAGGAAVAIAATIAPVSAQLTKSITGEVRTVTATVEAIERGRREVTVKKPDGQYEVLYVSPEIKRFDTLKVGDKINARYYETLVLQLKAPGDEAVDRSGSAVTPAAAGTAGTAAHQQTITATITAIDPKVPSITFTGPRGWTYSSRVEDKQALAKVKVGDRVDLTWTAAVVVALEEGK